MANWLRNGLVGCGCLLVLWPISIFIGGWLAFALGPMRCSLPNRCSSAQEAVLAIISLLILLAAMVLPVAIAVLSVRFINQMFRDRHHRR